MLRGFLGVHVLAHQGQGRVQVVGPLVQVAGLEALLDAGAVHLHAEGHAPVHGDGQGLGAAHAAQAGGEGPGAGEGTVEVLAGGLGEGLVGALDDALAADVDPAAGGHLAVHHQALLVEFPEVLPGGPLRHQVGVGDEDARRLGMGLHDAHGLAALHQQRLVVVQVLQLLHDGVEAVPVPGGLAQAAVDHQVLGPLGHLGIEVVHEHPQGRLLHPALAVQVRAAGRGEDGGVGGDGHGGLP